MIRSLLIGAVAGMRAMTPLAAVAVAARRNALPRGNGAPALLGAPFVAAGALALAVGELAGDKMPSAPDRIAAPGIAARLVTGAIAGAALAPRDRRTLAAAAGGAAAVGSAYLTWRLRMRAARHFGQTAAGLVEDAIAVGGALLIVGSARRG